MSRRKMTEREKKAKTDAMRPLGKDDTFYSLAEAREVLGLTKTGMAHRIYRGYVQVVKFNSQYWVSSTELQRVKKLGRLRTPRKSGTGTGTGTSAGQG